MTEPIEHAPEDLGPAVAGLVAADLEEAVEAHGKASLAVPGGETARPFLDALGRAPIAWDRVTVTLTDERWVPSTDPQSNQRMLSETLFAGRAAAAGFVPLYGATAEPADAVAPLAASLEQLALPLDVCVLGMGEDGHIAALIPSTVGLEAALDGARPVGVVLPGQGPTRMTLTAGPIRGAAKRYLLIRGETRRAALARARRLFSPASAPVRVALDAPGGCEIHWAP